MKGGMSLGFLRVSAIIILIAMSLPLAAYADDSHGNTIFHAFTLDMSVGNNDDGNRSGDWDLDGWVGSDENKLWLKSEGERSDGETEAAEFWALYSRNVSEFWDLQIGIRYDTKPHALTYGVVGFDGLAVYFFETAAHLFVSEDGVSARLKQEKELLFTQRLIAEPYFEINLYAQDVPELDVAAGLSAAELGVHTRYEVTRAFAPYLEIKYARLFGETAAIAKRHSADSGTFTGALGLRVSF